MNTIVDEKLISFKGLEQKIFRFVCGIGRDMTRMYLEDFDNEIARERDTKEYRDKGKRKTSIKIHLLPSALQGYLCLLVESGALPHTSASSKEPG